MSAQRVARENDSCSLTCAEHGGVTGTFSEGTDIVKIDGGRRIVLIGHTGVATCGHHFKATAGSSVGNVLGVPIVRVGDAVQFTDVGGTGTVTSGSDVYSLN